VALGCFISPGRSLEAAVERVTLADELGYEACYVTQLAGRDALSVCAHYAAHTERIRLGTGVVPIYARAPAQMAQTAATVDEVSGGRFNLGMGVSHRPVVEGWFGTQIGKPLAEMREYAGIVRAILRGEPPPAGERWQTVFQLSGLDPRPDLPIYLAGLSPGMLRLAGEIANGVVLWLCTHTYIRDVVVPELTKGRERAGKPLDGFDIVAAVPCAVTDDPAAARATVRRDVAIPYFGLPFYRAMIERSGFEADVAAFDAAAGDIEAMRAAVSDEFLGKLAGVGDEETVRSVLKAYADAGTTSPCVGPIARTDVEGTLRAAAGALQPQAG
jgi:alkanesulfonate monooxygenase SsuD/methylene tetrahydromethanopterin reductase-like flavin-dependent oxidoreductase (luciferase family)